MLSEERAYQLIQDTMTGLRRGGLVKEEVTIGRETVLLGPGSPLDSLAFVTLIADLEDRLNRETGQEVSLVLDEIHGFNLNLPHLSVDILSKYIVNLTTRKL